jgi:hypothetical protein
MGDDANERRVAGDEVSARARHPAMALEGGIMSGIFKVGDRVEMVFPAWGQPAIGARGEVTGLDNMLVQVTFDESVRAAGGRAQWINEARLAYATRPVAAESAEEPWSCEHANECPTVCRCLEGCYCETRTCRRADPALAHGKPSNPKDAAAVCRLDLSLTPASARIYLALALTEGDAKYGGFNWREAGVLWSVYDAAIQRHALRLADGEWADPETQVPHLASMMACCAIIIDAHERGKLVDDRPPAGDAPRLLKWAEERTRHLRTMFAGRNATRCTAMNRDEEKEEEHDAAEGSDCSDGVRAGSVRERGY